MSCRWLAALALLTACDGVETRDASFVDASSSSDAAPPDSGATPLPDASPPPSDAGVTPEGWCAMGDTALGRVASALGAGEWGELDVHESLPAAMLHHHLTSWADTGVWNPITRRVQWVGSPGSCCADPSAYELLLYDVATDTWAVEETPWPDDTGHAYDGNALDPDTGIHYFARSSSIQGWDGEGWTPVPDPGRHPIAVGLTWFASTSSLVLVGSGVSILEDGAWRRVEAPDVSFGSYHQFAEYNPVHDVAWLGAGNGAVTRSAVLRPDGSLTQLADAPTTLNGDGRSMKTYDPVTGAFVVQNGEEDRWWTFDISSDTWTEITETVRAARPETWSRSAHDFVVPIDDCGVLFYFQRTRDFEYRLFVYRHAA
ncbi:MAG: hypothetical protein RLP09_06095 [Sandaracinaceae bacterium]|nr:hypothetical protein [Myxococcales bacterium]